MISFILHQTAAHRTTKMQYWTVFHTQNPNEVSMRMWPIGMSCVSEEDNMDTFKVDFIIFKDIFNILKNKF